MRVFGLLPRVALSGYNTRLLFDSIGLPFGLRSCLAALVAAVSILASCSLIRPISFCGMPAVNTLIALNGAWIGAILHERNNHSPGSRAARDVVVSMRGHGSKFGRKMDAAVDALLTQRNTEDGAKAGSIAMTAC